jgi:hypothetical protein
VLGWALEVRSSAQNMQNILCREKPEAVQSAAAGLHPWIVIHFEEG